MKTHHHKQLIIEDFCRDALQACLGNPKDKRMWWKDADKGFSIGQCDNTKIRGKYIWKDTAQVDSIDPETLEPIKKDVKHLCAAPFELNFAKQHMRVDKKAHFEIVQIALETIENAQFGLVDYEINLPQMVFEIQGAWKKNRIETLGIQDYLARENMIADASFKILEDLDAEKLVEKFDDQLKSVKLVLALPDGKVQLTVTRDGQIRVSDDAPEEIIMFVRDVMPQFHEPAVETTNLSPAQHLAKNLPKGTSMTFGEVTIEGEK